MGSFLSQVGRQGQVKTSCPMISLSLSKIRELHGSFKSICDNFAINLTEFGTIFAQDEKTFGIFDTDNNGLIDALELFSGLVILADATAEDKIRFLFDLFDFNEIQSMSVMDLQFTVYCVLNSTAKVFSIQSDLNEIELSVLIRQSFNVNVRITLPQVLKWSSLTDEIKTFFSYFRMEGPEMVSIKPLGSHEYDNYAKFQQALIQHEEEEQRPGEKLKPLLAVDQQRFVTKSAYQLITNRRSKNFRAWLTTALQPIISMRMDQKEMLNFQKVPDEVKVKLEWVYGIRSSDTRKSLQYTVGQVTAATKSELTLEMAEEKRSEEEIIYYTGCVVILLNTNVNKQRFYLSHDQEVIQVAVSTHDGLYIASSELAAAPSIHVWSRKTLESLVVLKGDHAQGVHLLSFSHDNQYLITCGITPVSACIIYDWRSAQVIMSTSINSPTQEIFLMHEIKYDRGQNAEGDFELDYDSADGERRAMRAKSGLVVLSLKELCIFVPKERTFVQTLLPLDQCTDECELYEPMCGLAIIAGTENEYHGALDCEHNGKRHMMLTGHKDGKVLMWRSDSYMGVLHDFEEEVSAINLCFEGIVFCTWAGRIHFWDINLKGATRSIELVSLPFKLLNHNITGCDFNQNRLLLVTHAGDAIEITCVEERGALSVKACRIDAITKITGQQKALAILNQTEQTVMIGGDDGIVTSFDISTHQLIDVLPVGAKITSLACLATDDGFLTALGTANGNVVLRQDWESEEPRFHQCGQKTINDVCFSKNGMYIAAASADKNVYLFNFVDGEYQKLSACKLDNGVPVSVNFSEDSKKIVICTNQRKLLLLDPVTFQLFFRAEDLTQHLWSNFIGRYPLNAKSQTSQFIPISLGNQSNIVIAGDDNGNIYLWRDTESIKEHIGANLTGHASAIQRLLLTQDDKRMLTLGLNDQSMFQWKVGKIVQKQTKPRDIQIKTVFKEGQEEEPDNLNKIFVTDESLINEVNFCYVSQSLDAEEDQLVSSVVDNAVLIRGCNNSIMIRLGAKYNFQFEEEVWKRPPAVGLVLDHIYGVQTSDRRNTVVYLHFHGDKPTEQMPQNASITQQLGIVGANNSRLDQVLPKLLGPNFQQLLDPNQQIKYDACHQNCHKYLAYFTSRFGVLYSPLKNQQTFYQGHSVKISVIAKHPTRRLIATGEVSINPAIHVWDTTTLEPLMVLETSHRGGVLHLAFSQDGKKLVSIGMDRAFSIQIFLWEQNRTIAFRNLGFYPVFGLKFFPNENSKFTTCGYQHMAVWRLQGNHLSCQTFQKYESQKINTEVVGEPLRSVLICLDYMSYRLGHTIESDCLFGTSQGEITTYCAGKHFVLNENAHKGSINVLRISDKLNDNINVITGGEDGFIKIWDTSIRLLQSIDTRTIGQVLKDMKNQRCYGVQSIEMYCCDKQSPRRILVGLRCGEILEAIITDQEGKKQKQPLMKEAGAGIGALAARAALLHFDFFTFVSGHSSLAGSSGQKKITCVMNPELPILASVGDDETLRFWDLIKKQIIISKYLGTQATAIAYSPDGSFLVVGLVNGIILILEARIQKLQYGTYMEEYTMPALDIVMSPKEAKAAIVCMKFSYRGDYLAVAFNNEYRDDSQKPDKTLGGDVGSPQPSFIIIYVNRLSSKNPGIKLNSKDPYVKLLKFTIPLQNFQSSASIRKQLAVTSMDFSDDDCYLQLCLQTINHECIIDTSAYKSGENNIFVIWDMQVNQLFTSFETLKTTQWPEWSMAPAINARFHGTEIQLEDAIEERQLLFRELTFMSRIAKFSLQPNAICGSHQGGLYLFRFDALTIDKMKVTDFKYDLVRKSEMADTRCFQGHTSMVQSIEIFEDKTVLSTSVNDQCVLQWRVEYEDKHWELDFNQVEYDSQTVSPVPQQPADPYFEILSQPKFDKLCNEVWSQRLQVAEINQGVSKTEFEDPASEFHLQYIIGRRAIDRRMNIKIDCRDRITYQASSLQVFLTENDEDDQAQQAEGITSYIKQEFLRPDGNKFKSVSPELSCFCLTKDTRILFIATAQTVANVYIWDVTTNMKLGEFVVPNVPIITNIKVSHDNKHVLLLGITKEYFQVMSMVDWTRGNKVLFTRQFLHSITCRIREIEFLPNKVLSFITAGIQHLCFWKLSGQNLEYQTGELTIPKVFTAMGQGALNPNPGLNKKYGMQLVSKEGGRVDEFDRQRNNQDDDLENLYVTFLNCIFIGEMLITSGDDGFLYMWDKFRIVRRIFAHEGAIYALHCNSKLGLMVSGGMEGTVNLWRLMNEQKSRVQTLERLKIYNLRKNAENAQVAVQTPECNVQSLCLGYNRIIVGMRSGTIHEVVISEDRKLIKPHHDANDPVKRWLTCTDHHAPKSIGIDMISSRIFTITAEGLLTVWDLRNFNIIYQFNFKKKAQSLQAFRITNRILLIFEHDVHVLDSDPKTNKFQDLKPYNLILNKITFATLNQDEQILGIATISAAQPDVTLYATDGGLIKIKQITGFKSSIRYLDFSTDNFYMQVEDNAGEVHLYELENDKVLPQNIGFELQWLGEGLRSYSRLKGVKYQYNNNNKIVQIKKMLGKPIVVIADELGTIRVFNYPNTKGEPYYQSYTDHLFFIADIIFTPDRLSFLSACGMDRCVFMWKIKLNEEKINAMLEMEMRKLNNEDDDDVNSK